MSKQVYISADYAEYDGDRNVVEELNKWGSDNLHKVDFIDMSKVSSGSVSENQDCRICDLKQEFNKQINASSAVIFVVGNKTALRTAGNQCDRVNKNKIYVNVRLINKILMEQNHVKSMLLQNQLKMVI